MKIVRPFIHGAYTDAGGDTFANINPATGDVLAMVQTADVADVAAAVRSAQEGWMQWSALSGTARGRVLYRVQEMLRARNEELAMLETLDTGKPIRESREVDIHLGADCFEYYAGVAPTISGEHMHFPSGFSYTRRESLGVCAGIGAWNYPLQVACWKIAPALACGNAVVYKPSELTPTTTALLGEILCAAGVPAGACNIVHGGAITGALLSRHPDIAKISLTGEVSTGKAVMADAATTLKNVTMELGGKSPLIVFADADVDNAVNAAMLGNFYTQGEICTNCTRVFLHSDIKDAFVRRLLEKTKKLVVGAPEDPQTQIGALISEAHRHKVLGYIEKAKRAGASLLCGGKAPTAGALAKGAFVMPTIFTDCRDDMPHVCEEIFGPVMSLLSFTDEDEVVRRANNTPYGLAQQLQRLSDANAGRRF